MENEDCEYLEGVLCIVFARELESKKGGHGWVEEGFYTRAPRPLAGAVDDRRRRVLRLRSLFGIASTIQKDGDTKPPMLIDFQPGMT